MKGSRLMYFGAAEDSEWDIRKVQVGDFSVQR